MVTKLVHPKHTQLMLHTKLGVFDPCPVEKRGLDIIGLNEMSEKLETNGL